MATPTVTLNPDPLQRGLQAVFTVVWDEVVTGFEVSDGIIYINAIIFSGDVNFVAVSGTTYTFTFTVPATTFVGANVFFFIPTNSVDQENQGIVPSFLPVVESAAGVVPTITFRQDRYNAGDTAIADITLDSDDITLLESHLTATGGASITSFSGSGTAYVVNISVPSTPEDGTVGLTIAEIEIGDETLAAASATVPYYTTATVTLSFANSSVDAGTTQTATAVFNKVVSGLTLGDFSANMGTVQNLRTTDNITFMVDVVMPSTGAGDVTLTLAANAVDAGNAEASASISYLTRGVPAITFGVTFAFHGSVVTATIVWNIDVDDFVIADVSIVNGVLGDMTGSGDTYSIPITVPSEGTGETTITIAEDSVSAGNGEISASLNYGPITPILSAVGTQFFAGVIFTVEITTPVDVTGLTIDDVFVVGGTVDAFREISGSEYEVDIRPPDSGMGLIEITIGADAVNEGNDASSTLAVNYSDDPNAPIIGVVSLVSIPVFFDTEEEQEDRDTFELEIPISGDPDEVVVSGLQDSFYYDWEAGDDICYVRGRPKSLVKERIWNVMAVKELSNRDIERQRMIMYEVVPRAPVIDKTVGRQQVYQGAEFNLLIPVANNPSTATVISPILGTTSDIEDEGVRIKGDIPFGANFTIDESMFELEVSNDAGMDDFDVLFDISKDVPTPPLNLEVDNITATTARITYEAPSHTGESAIIRYEYSIDLEEWTSLGTALTAVITGLGVGAEIVVYVRAVNTHGNGGRTPGFSFTTLSEPRFFFANANISNALSLSTLNPQNVSGDPTTWAAAGLPSGWSIDESTGAISGNPRGEFNITRQDNITVTATSAGGSYNFDFALSIGTPATINEITSIVADAGDIARPSLTIRGSDPIRYEFSASQYMVYDAVNDRIVVRSNDLYYPYRSSGSTESDGGDWIRVTNLYGMLQEYFQLTIRSYPTIFPNLFDETIVITGTTGFRVTFRNEDIQNNPIFFTDAGNDEENIGYSRITRLEYRIRYFNIQTITWNSQDGTQYSDSTEIDWSSWRSAGLNETFNISFTDIYRNYIEGPYPDETERYRRYYLHRNAEIEFRYENAVGESQVSSFGPNDPGQPDDVQLSE